MKRLLQFVIFAPLAIILIAFSVANRHVVKVSFDPFSTIDPAISFSIPLYWLVFINLFIGMLIGGFVVWMKQGRFRKEARDQRYEAAKARHEVKKVQETNSNSSNGLSTALMAPKA